MEWGISFLHEISAYIKINVKKDQNNDVSTVWRSFSRWEVKKISMFFTSQLENDRQTIEMSLSLF